MDMNKVPVLFEKEGSKYFRLMQRDFVSLKLVSVLNIGTASLLCLNEIDHRSGPCTFGFWNTDTNLFRGLSTLFDPSQKIFAFKSFPLGDSSGRAILTTLSFNTDEFAKHLELMQIFNLEDIIEVFNVSWSFMCLFYRQRARSAVFGKYHHTTQKFDEYVFCEPHSNGVSLKDTREMLRRIAYHDNSSAP